MRADRVLTPRELDRATLARQMLLDRERIPALGATARLVGLQAQVPNPPYVGLWTRSEEFRREDLTRPMEERQIVRAPLMRSTLHLMRAEDHLLLWPALQPVLVRPERLLRQEGQGSGRREARRRGARDPGGGAADHGRAQGGARRGRAGPRR